MIQDHLYKGLLKLTFYKCTKKLRTGKKRKQKNKRTAVFKLKQSSIVLLDYIWQHMWFFYYLDWSILSREKIKDSRIAHSKALTLAIKIKKVDLKSNNSNYINVGGLKALFRKQRFSEWNNKGK